MKRNNFRPHLILLAIMVFFVGCLITFLYLKSGTSTYEFESRELGMKFFYPKTYTLLLSKTNGHIVDRNNRKITFGTQGTPYRSSYEFLESRKMTDDILNEERQDSNGGIWTDDKNNQISYIVVKNYRLYYLSTSNPELFPVMEEIVKTFKILD